MKIVYMLMLMLGACVLWAFLSFPPYYPNKKPIRVYNMTCITLCAFFIAIYVANIRGIFVTPATEQYAGIFIACGSFVIELVLLTVFFLLRNFWIFKPKRLGSQRLF